MLLSTVQVASRKKIPKEIKKINKALDLPPKSTFMWDLLSIYKMKEDILKNKADIAKYHPNTTASTITTTKTITTTTTTTTTFGQSGKKFKNRINLCRFLFYFILQVTKLKKCKSWHPK